jgi:large subunit ribosomal protein L5
MSSSRYQQLYRDKIRPELKEKLGCKSIMEVPELRSITLNVGVGKVAVADKKIVDNAIRDLTQISGQKAVKTLARKSIAGFKLREGMPIGARVTLRGKRMYDFFERLVCISIPRIRDFRGISSKFDGRGNFSMGIREQIVFPEIEYDKIDAIRGLDIAFTTSAKTNEHGRALFDAFNFPFKDKE